MMSLVLSSIWVNPTVQIATYSIASAVFYTGSMAAMKFWTQTPSVILIMAIAVAVLFGVGFEIMALKAERLGLIYVTILAVEVGLIALVSCLIFGESFTFREIAGCALIIGGTALAWS